MTALATSSPGGRLLPLNPEQCWIKIPKPAGGDPHMVIPKILPEISDAKQANYADVNVIGRSSPIKTFSHSANRVISIRLHFIVIEMTDFDENQEDVWALQSALYPREGSPYKPPPICAIKCGWLLSKTPLCVVLNNYSISYPSNVAWNKTYMYPYYFQMQTSWHVVYATEGQNSLPNQQRILKSGL